MSLSREGASARRRGAAALLDALPCVLFLIIPYSLGFLSWRAWLSPPDRFWLDHALELWWSRPGEMVRPCVWWLLCWSGQHFFWVYLGGGRTLGSRALGLRVVTRGGGTPGAVHAALRVLGHGVSAASLGLGWGWCWVDAERRSWVDLISGTRLIRG